MNGIDLLITKLDSEAAADAEARIAEANAKAEEIRAEYAARAEADAKKLLDEVAAQCVSEAQRADGGTALEARKALLAAKHEMIDRAFERARLKLCRLQDEEYRAFLLGVIANAAVEGNELVVFNERDRNLFGKSIISDFNAALRAAGKPAHLKLSAETRDIDGGFILCSGQVETNCSISSIIAQNKNELTELVARMLF